MIKPMNPERNKEIYDFLDSIGRTTFQERERMQKRQRLQIEAYRNPLEMKELLGTYDRFDIRFNPLEKLLEDEQGYIRPLIGISGSWQQTNAEVIDDVYNVVSYALSKGMGIITGGAPGVDNVAIRTVLEAVRKRDIPKKLRVVLPVNKYSFIERFQDAIKKGKSKKGIEASQAREHIYLLEGLYKFRDIVFDETHFEEDRFLVGRNDDYRTLAYLDRNGLIVYGCDALVAFLVNNTRGTEDTIKKCHAIGKPYEIKKYMSDESETIRDYDRPIIRDISSNPKTSDSGIIEIS